MSNHGWILALDIGTSCVKAAAIARDGSLLADAESSNFKSISQHDNQVSHQYLTSAYALTHFSIATLIFFVSTPSYHI